MTGQVVINGRFKVGLPEAGAETWLPPLRDLIIAMLLVGATGWIADSLAEGTAGFEYIWPANAILLAMLVTSPARQWPVYLVAGFFANFLARWATGGSLWLIVGIPLSNSLEIYLAAIATRRWAGVSSRLGGRGEIGYFLLFAVIVAPAISSTFAAMLSTVIAGVSYGSIFTVRYLAHALGMAVFFSPVMAIRIGDAGVLFRYARLPEAAMVFGATTGVIALVFWQNQYPLLFVIFPFLVWSAFRFGFVGVMASLLLTTCIGVGATVAGHGPLALIPGADDVERIFILQFFLVVANFATLPIAVTLEERRLQDTKLRESEERFRFLSENSSDLILLLGLDGLRKYVSPSFTEILGWSPDEVIGKSVYGSMHPDDAVTLENVMRAVNRGDKSYGNPFMATFRTLHKDGHSVWMEVHIRRVDDPTTGTPLELVVTGHDVTARKAAEEQLAIANRQLEELARNDGLTGIANRRSFDETLTREWLRSMREKQPLALLMLDIDWFKLLNDLHGHGSGDRALQQIAQIVAGAMRRPGDFAARYGGEEFALLLPNTPLAGAMIVAENIRIGVQELKIENANTIFGVATISIGVASIAPRPGMDPALLVETADQALYRAKHQGRNRVEGAPNTDAQNG